MFNGFNWMKKMGRFQHKPNTIKQWTIQSKDYQFEMSLTFALKKAKKHFFRRGWTFLLFEDTCLFLWVVANISDIGSQSI